MCHLRKFIYLCDHSDTIVISPCRQATLKIKRSNTASPAEKWLHLKETGELKLRGKGPEQILSYVPACRPSPSLHLAVKQVCGVCLFGQEMGEWSTRIEALEAKVAEARGLWGADDGLLPRLEQELEQLSAQRGEAEWQCRQQFPTTRHGRPLKSDRPGIKINCGSPLRTELMWEDVQVKDEPEMRAVDEHGIPYTTFWDFFSDRYLWLGPVLDWSEESVNCNIHETSIILKQDEPYLPSMGAERREFETEALFDTASKLECLILGPKTVKHALRVEEGSAKKSTCAHEQAI